MSMRNNSASPANYDPARPGVRMVWTSSTLAAYRRDPFTYYLRYVRGLGEGRDRTAMDWGSLYHDATGAMHTAWSMGEDRDAVLAAQLARFPHAELADPPLACHTNQALARALIWYDAWWHGQPRRYVPALHPDKRPMLEVEWELEVPGEPAPNGQPYVLQGHLDQVVLREGRMWIVERKTTKKTIGANFWRTYDPSYQMHCYLLAGQALFGDLFGGVMYEGCQTAVGFTRFHTHDVPAFDNSAWWGNVRWVIGEAERVALAGTWQAAANPDFPFHSADTVRILRSPQVLWPRLAEAFFVAEDA